MNVEATMNPTLLLLVAIGGAAGSVARALVGGLATARFPWGTLAVNVIGSLLIGLLLAKVAGTEGEGARRMHALLVTGFCGGFTTFSAFSWQTFEQLQRGAWGAAAANVALSLLMCLAAVALGFKLGRA
jgi:fluoride exporter